MRERFKTVDYAEVIGELQRKDCSGVYYIDKLPPESEVEKILSDSHIVRYILYTQDKTYTIYIHEYANMETPDDAFYEWEMYVLDR